MGSAAVDPALAAIWAEVLGVDEPDVDDDFFALGGTSLLATQITARVADALGVEVPLEALFDAPKLGAYAALVRDAAPAAAQRPAGTAPPSPPGGGRGRGGALRRLRGGRRRGGRTGRSRGESRAVDDDALPHAQASAWAVQRYSPSTRPHVGQVFALHGPLDPAALERALTALVARHEILRTAFPLADHRPRARVQSPGPAPLEHVSLPKRAREAEARRAVDAAWQEPFDYEHAPPVRLRLIRTGKQSHLLVFLLHELLCDGQAFDLLVRELGLLYRGEREAGPSPLPDPAPQYRDIVRAHGPRLAAGATADGAQHWREALAGAPLTIPLPLRDGTAATGRSEIARRSGQLSAQLCERLRQLAREEAATAFMLHLATLFALLHRHTGETDLLVRSPAANRAHVEWERTVGFFSMVLSLRVDAGGDPSFRELLRRTRACALAAFRHAADAPEDNRLREADGLRGIGGWAPTFRLWDPTTEQPLELDGVQARPYRDDGEAGRLVLVVTERADGRTTAQLSSTAEQLGARGVGELLRHYERLLEAVAEDPDRRIGTGVELLTPSERDKLGGRLAGGGGEPADERGLAGLVEAQARRAPNAIACDAGDGAALTYGELDARAARLARALRARGVGDGPEDLVGLPIAPSRELLVAMLAVLKAGGACVPLREPGAGGDRDPLADLPLATHVTGEEAAEAAAREADGGADGTPDGGAIAADRLALVLPSAGGGGAPRAVRLTHGALRRAALRERNAHRLGAADRVAHVPGRGAWSWALAPWAALAGGATVAGPERAPDPHGGSSPSGWLADVRATVAATGAPSACAALAQPDALPATLRLLLVQGPGELTMPDEAAARGTLVVRRQYGLAEAGGALLSERATRSVAAGAPLAGEPAGMRARVLDAHGNVAPAGVAGELRLDDGEQAVRTGDLARRRTDGALEVFGPLADEVRHRGLRLNPVMRDVEVALAAHPAVRAAATCWVPEHAALVACLVPLRAGLPAPLELDLWLQRTMDDWVLPACQVAVPAIPRRADGLPDRRALAALPAVADALAARTAGGDPQSRTERGLAAIWTDVLGVRRPGVHDNFFASGGTLVRGIELADRAQAAGIAIDPGDVLYRPTISLLAASADAKR